MAGFVPLRFCLLSPRKPLRWVFAGAPCVWPKKMRRARWKKKPLGPNLPVLASLGMRTADSQLSADLPSFIQVRCNAPLHPRLCRKLSRLFKFQGACRNALPLAPLPLPGMDSKGRGRSPFLLGVQERGPGGNPAARVSPWPLFGGDPFLSAREMGRICSPPSRCPPKRKKGRPTGSPLF